MIGIIRKIQNYFADQVDLQQYLKNDQPAVAPSPARDQFGAPFNSPGDVPTIAYAAEDFGRAYGVN